MVQVIHFRYSVHKSSYQSNGSDVVLQKRAGKFHKDWNRGELSELDAVPVVCVQRVSLVDRQLRRLERVVVRVEFSLISRIVGVFAHIT